MIINQNNKEFILKGKMKRGFNQTPEELKEKLSSQKMNINQKQENSNKITEDYLKLKKIRNDLKRF